MLIFELDKICETGCFVPFVLPAKAVDCQEAYVIGVGFLKHALCKHRVCNLFEACNVCSDDIVARVSILGCCLMAGIVNFAHDFVEACVHFFAGPS